MASPLATIRKYDKILLAVFGVLLMFAFLIADPLTMLTTGGGGGGGGGRQPDAVVTFKKGSLNDMQLAVMHRADNLADEVIRRVAEAAKKKDRTPRDFPATPPERRAAKSENELVDQVLLAHKAHEYGLSLSDQDIDEILQQFSVEAVKPDELRKIRREVLEEARGSTYQITERDLYAQLRRKFLAEQLAAMVQGEVESRSRIIPAMTVTPTQAWDYYRRFARSVAVEVMPLEVEKFLDDVKVPPTKAQIDEWFTKYKDAIPAPNSPEPGLASPKKIAFGYVRIDMQKFLDEAKAKITEEEMRAEYDKRVEQGDFTVPELPEDKDKNKEKDAADDKKPADPADPKPDDAKQDESKKPENKKEETKPDEDSLDNDEEDESSDEPEAKVEAKSDEKDKPDPKSDPADAKKPAEGNKESDDKKPETEKKDKDPKSEKKTRIKTFEEVKDDILTSLAQKPAADKRREAYEKLARALDAYRAKYRQWQFDKEQAEKSKKGVPEKPAIEPLLRDVLKEYELSYKQLDLMDRFEVEQDELGESSLFFPGQFTPIPFTNIYFARLEPYEMMQSSGLLRDVAYLFWKEDEVEAKPAERNEAEEAIVRGWKMQQAYEEALKEAKKLADQARDAENLHKAFPDGVERAGAIQETKPFSWLTSGGLPFGMGNLQMSEIPEVPYAGEEFMQAVMDLKPGEVGFAPDQSHRRVYLIRVVSQTPDEDVLRQMFMLRGIHDPNVMMQYRSDRGQQLRTWFTNLEKEMQVNWNRPPQPFQ